MILKNFSPFLGQHCETTATGSLLHSLGIQFTEPMLFGLGEGLGFIYWDMKGMDFPFLGGRIKAGLLTQNLAKNLGLEYRKQETSSLKRAWSNVEMQLHQGIPVGLQLDFYYLDYFTKKSHFAGHFVAMYGYDNTYAYLVDTIPQGSTVQTRLDQLALARNEKGPMASRNLSYTLTKRAELPLLKTSVVQAIRRNAEDFLHPPIRNVNYQGIQKASVEIKTWFQRSKHIETDLPLAAILMERGGTGGALFRNLYRDFLGESLVLLEDQNLRKAYDLFCQIASLWTEVSRNIHCAGESQNQAFLDEASLILLEISNKEKEAMERLSQVSE